MSEEKIMSGFNINQMRDASSCENVKNKIKRDEQKNRENTEKEMRTKLKMGNIMQTLNSHIRKLCCGCPEQDRPIYFS